MATSLNDFKEQVQPIIRDRTDNVVTDADYIASANRTAKAMINDHGIYASKNTADILVYANVYEYPLPADFHDLRAISYRGSRTSALRYSGFTETIAVEFWRRTEERDLIAIDTILGQQFLLLSSQSIGSRSVPNDLSSLTGNGSWAIVAATDAINISTDELIKTVGSASIAFNVDVSASVANAAAISNTTLRSVDWTNYLNKAKLFLDVYLPDATNITGVTARWGENSSNYYESTTTTAHSGLALRQGFNQVGINWNGATVVGTPVVSSINYLHLQINYTSAQTDMVSVRFDNVFMALPQLLEVQYYSTHYAVDGVTGVKKSKFERMSDTTLLLNVDDDVFFWNLLCDAQWILEMFGEKEESEKRASKALRTIKARHASERKQAVVRYY